MTSFSSNYFLLSGYRRDMVPPKIEVIEEIAPVPRKNPFAPKSKKKTVKRDANEVYPQRKGLNKPDYIGDSPLDRLFLELETVLEGEIEDCGVSELQQRMKLEGGSDFDQIYQVVEKLFLYLLDIQKLTLEAKPVNDDKNLIKISLHDIKTFGKLVNLIIVRGVYPALNTFHIGVPFEKRRLNDFAKNKKQIKITPLPPVNGATSYKEKYGNVEKLLTLIYLNFKQLFSVQSDISELLIKGTGYTDFLTVSLTLGTVPYFDSNRRQEYLSEFNSFVITLPDTYELFQTFSLYLTTPSPAFFKQFVMARLLTLHFDCPHQDGVKALCEYILGMRENEEINIERFEHVSNVILLKPKSVSTVDYFSNIGKQLYDLLVNIDKPVITNCICFVIDRLWVRSPLVLRDFVAKLIWERFNPSESESTVLVSEATLNNNVNVLISLTKGNISVQLLESIFEPILIPIWSYFTFLKSNNKNTEVIQNVLTSYFTLLDDTITDNETNAALKGLDVISKNLVVEGGMSWKFEFGNNGLLQIVKIEESPIKTGSDHNKVNSFLEKLDANCEYFVNFLKELNPDLVLGLFNLVLQRWLGLSYQDSKTGLGDDSTSSFFVLIDLRLLENLVNEFKDSIAKTPSEMLDIVKNFLVSREKVLANGKSTASNLIIKKEEEDSDDEDSDDDEELAGDDLSGNVLPMILELLSAILSETITLEESSITLLKDINKLLKTIGTYQQAETSTANSITSLSSRIDELLNGDVIPTTTQDLHTKTLKRAITNLNDPLVPIRAHGLYLLRQLVELRSEHISLDFVINLHLVQLKDPEPYIYLNVIKGLVSLIEWDEPKVLRILLSSYLNENGSTDLDEELKIGEVILRYIQIKNELFSGSLAKLVVEACMKLIRRPANDADKHDNRLRMSAMSLLGTCCSTNPIGIIDDLNDALDCAIGILELETDKEEAIMRRSAIVLIHDLIIGTANTANIPFPESYQQKVVTTLRYIVESDNDLLVRDQARATLGTIEQLGRQEMEMA